MRYVGVMLSASAVVALSLMASLGASPVALAQSTSKTSSSPKEKSAKEKSEKSLKEKSAKEESVVLAKVGKELVTAKALEEAYRKNASVKTTAFAQLHADSLREFLNLYINYRLKVQDAIERGFDKKPDVLADIQQNRASLAMPYLTERVLLNPALDTAIQRRRSQFKVGLILSRIGAKEDSLRAFKRAQGIIKLVTKGGQDFMKVLKDSTEDEYGKRSDGDYGWVVAGQLVRELEDAVYTLKVGEVYPYPVRTKAGNMPGYFVVKLLEMKPRVTILGSQILFAVKDSADTNVVRAKAQMMLDSIRAGKSFAAVAKQYSDDKSTSEYGGQFPAYYNDLTGYINGLRYKWRPEIVSAMYALRDGEMSGLVQTDLGFHILRRDSTMRGGDDRESLKRFYKQYQFEDDKKRLIEAAKKKQGIKINQKTLAAFLKPLDAAEPFTDEQAAKLPAKLLGEALFSSGSASFNVARFRDSLLKSPSVRGYSLTRDGMTTAIDKLSESLVIEGMLANLERDYPEFATLMREFHDGILIFRVEEQEIWSKMKFDTARARIYHDSIKSRFQTPIKYDFSEIYFKKDSAAQAALKKLKAGANFDSLAAAVTEREGYKEKKGRWKPVESWETVLTDHVTKLKEKETSAKPFPNEGGFSICRLNAVIQPRQKTFEEAIPDFAAQFQDAVQKELMHKWLASLREKYPVVIEQTTIDKLWRHGVN
jgi:peptidyl-prolyl cis-trans isomerase SurA